jgi:hypothetical protein
MDQIRGSYLFEITGYHSDTNGHPNMMKILIEYGPNIKWVNIPLYQNSSYGYPFSFRQ